MLTSFVDGVFQDLVNLRELWGYGNNIKQLSAQSLHGLHNLNQLILYKRMQHISSISKPYQSKRGLAWIQRA